MASAIERLLGHRITRGFINVPDGVTARVHRIKLNPARHPIPDERGVEGARQITAIAQEARDRDLVICLISGGSVRAAARACLRSNARTEAINHVRTSQERRNYSSAQYRPQAPEHD